MLTYHPGDDMTSFHTFEIKQPLFYCLRLFLLSHSSCLLLLIRLSEGVSHLTLNAAQGMEIVVLGFTGVAI